MKVVQGKDNNEFLLIDEDEHVLRRGYIYEFPEAKILLKDRMNYYIDIVREGDDTTREYDQLMLDKLVATGCELRGKHLDADAFIYHCALSSNIKKIAFFKSFSELDAHEGMHLLKLSTNTLSDYSIDSSLYSVRYDYLATSHEIDSFLAEHAKIFGGAYDEDKIRELQKENDLNCITIFDGATIAGNILTMVDKKNGHLAGIVEDMFVASVYTKQGLGSFLLQEGLRHLWASDVHHIELEVWSANSRAYKLYEKFGFVFDVETETSIGVYV